MKPTGGIAAVALLLLAGGAFLFSCSKEEAPHVDGLDMPPPVVPTGPSGTFLRVGDMIQARKNHRGALLPSGDVLVAGGEDGTGTVLATAEMYRYNQGGVFHGAPFPMNSARTEFGWVPLDSVHGNRILVCGGRNASAAALDGAELFDPATYKFDPASGTMTSPRRRFAAVRLPNGNVFVCGGLDASGAPLASCEVFDPAAGTFTRTASDMATARADHAACLLVNGKVLIAGGTDASGNAVQAAELFDPGSGSGVQGTFAATANLPSARAGHVAAPVNQGAYQGQVVLFGGYQGPAASPAPLNHAVAFDPAASGGAGAFTGVANLMDSPRHGMTATVLSGGLKVLAAGGNALNTPELFDPYASTAGGTLALDADFVRTLDGAGAATGMAAVVSGRRFHEAVWLQNGTILLCGGEDGAAVTATAELYNP